MNINFKLIYKQLIFYFFYLLFSIFLYIYFYFFIINEFYYYLQVYINLIMTRNIYISIFLITIIIKINRLNKKTRIYKNRVKREIIFFLNNIYKYKILVFYIFLIIILQL